MTLQQRGVVWNTTKSKKDNATMGLRHFDPHIVVEWVIDGVPFCVSLTYVLSAVARWIL